MGLFDKLTGTRRPAGGVAPCSAEEVHAALLALNGPEVPYVVRDGAAEGVDLVAEWRMTEPAWHTFFARTQLSRAVQIRMRLVSEDHEVRVAEEQREVTWVGGSPRFAMSREYGRGPTKTVSRHWTIGRRSDGHVERTETFRYDSSELKEPLQGAVLTAGWTWRGVLFGKV
ncbi:hypothetical protein RCO28_36290 [Streptomyces sp. LHD-70]|uniref:hypothetical protein n=1 Tax=Streptomyces sp. LHD-70 TaxID=3072140 RepID=UPI00280FDDA0|nr:hypothetical protein [Streptomyces sp. LHD-70]MDQ8707890.1 hypothetical protein [Streptomyces sp. LHD-70]